MSAISDNFHGCKVALFLGDKLVTILRDDRADIPYPNLWDFPGGGREAGERPEDTVARETHEEIGLHLPADAFQWRRRYPSSTHPNRFHWFFVATLPASRADQIVFGDEGQSWKLVTATEFLAMPNTVPMLPPRLTDWITATGQSTQKQFKSEA